MELHNKLNDIGFDFIDINPLTNNRIYQDDEGNQIEILHDVEDKEE